MAEHVSYVMWYTVYAAKTGELVAAGTATMCARKLGYANSGSFISAVSHRLSAKYPVRKYIFVRECIDCSEVDSLPPVRRRRKRCKTHVCHE